MDLTGQGRFTAYKVDRPLAEQEQAMEHSTNISTLE